MNDLHRVRKSLIALNDELIAPANTAYDEGVRAGIRASLDIVTSLLAAEEKQLDEYYMKSNLSDL